MTIDALIDKYDSFELVRDQIAAILVTEVASQKALATAGGKDPLLWDFSVYTERFRPFEAGLDPALVNVWYDNSTFPMSEGDVVKRQTSESVFNIDCYASKSSSSALAGGYNSGDELAARDLQRVIRLVRNIIMSAENVYLQMRTVVSTRWFQSINQYQPQQGDSPVENIIAARMALRVKFNEFSPQITPEDLETIIIQTARAEDGKIILNAEYDVT